MRCVRSSIGETAWRHPGSDQHARPRRRALRGSRYPPPRRTCYRPGRSRRHPARHQPRPLSAVRKMSPEATMDSLWYERAWFRTSVTYGFVLLVLVKFVHSVFLKENDFDVHLVWGQMALDATHGDAGPFLALKFHYPPGRFLINEGFALLPRLSRRTIRVCAAVAALVVPPGTLPMSP